MYNRTDGAFGTYIYSRSDLCIQTLLPYEKRAKGWGRDWHLCHLNTCLPSLTYRAVDLRNNDT